MSTRPDEERDLFAAEYALGVLDGAERAEAEALAGSDPAFARSVEAWNERLAPLLAEIAEVAPDPRLWDRINAALDLGGLRRSNVVSLERKLTLWRGYAAVATAAAAALVLVVGIEGVGRRPPVQEPPVEQPRQPTLVANVAAEDRSAAFVVAFNPDEKRLLVTPAVASPAPGHDHELWVIPASGTPRSLGLVAATGPHSLAVPPALVSELRRDATLAVSVEPVGGSPTGQPTGPVVATGKMTLI